MKKVFNIFLAVLLFLVACNPVEKHSGPTEDIETEDVLQNFPIDFSMVGYQYGTKSIPDYDVVVTLTAPADGADATALIQNAIDGMTTTGTILLKAGTYNVSGKLTLAKSNVVLRGEGDATVIKATGTTQRTLLTLGKSTSRKDGVAINISDEYVPVGQDWVTVVNPSAFQVGSRVNVKASMNQVWVTDLKMDRISQNSTNTVNLW